MKNKIAFLWVLFFILLFTAFYLIYVFYSLVISSAVPSQTVSGIVPVFSIYGFGKNPSDLLNKPHDVQVDDTGNLVVSDTRNSRVLILTRTGKLIKEIKDDFLRRPLGVSVSKDGKIAVCDSFSSALLIFDENGSVIKRVAVTRPIKPAFYEGRLYVSTAGSIAVFDEAGKFLFHWGSSGKQPGQFSFPNGLEVAGGRIFVSDTNNLRVQAFTLRGELVWNVGEPPKDIKQTERIFSLPAGITVDGRGTLYVVDAFSNSIVILNPSNGKVVRSVGGKKGELEGEFNQPSGIDWIEEDLFAVADKYNDRIQLVRIVTAEKPAKSSEDKERLVQLLFVASALSIAFIAMLIVRYFYRNRKEQRENSG